MAVGFDVPPRMLLSFRDVMIQVYELERTKITEDRNVAVNKPSLYSTDACTLRHSRGVSLGPWNFEARVTFY